IHEATWREVEERFGFTNRRRFLLVGLKDALASLRKAGCRRAYVDGSFVTAKIEPGDFDACWEADGVDPDILDPVLLEFSNRRAAQKEKFGGEMFVANSAAAPSGIRFLDFFQCDKDGNPKGIVSLKLMEHSP
ncbi:MAG: DUF6932 family protein, partial [Burkholderiales bacterium]